MKQKAAKGILGVGTAV